jgi:hypothetical protein
MKSPVFFKIVLYANVCCDDCQALSGLNTRKYRKQSQKRNKTALLRKNSHSVIISAAGYSGSKAVLHKLAAVAFLKSFSKTSCCSQALPPLLQGVVGC